MQPNTTLPPNSLPVSRWRNPSTASGYSASPCRIICRANAS
jgi:hypothetical protein